MKEARPAFVRFSLLIVLILGSSAFQAKAYYHPDEGRWLNRDPIGEQAGGLLGFAGSNPINSIDPKGLWYVCVGPEVGATAFIGPVVPTGLIGFGLGVSWTPQVCVGKNAAGLFCDYCETSTLTVMPIGAGSVMTLGVGWVFTAGLGNSPDGYSLTVGVGAGLGPIPGSPLAYEILVDVSIDNSSVSVTIPRGSIGIAYYVAMRVSGNCTGCGGNAKGLDKVAVARARRIACEENALQAVAKAIRALSSAVFPGILTASGIEIGPTTVPVTDLPSGPWSDTPGESY